MEQSETTHELTLEEAVALAILLQKNEQLVQAHELYGRVLVSRNNRHGSSWLNFRCLANAMSLTS